MKNKMYNPINDGDIAYLLYGGERDTLKAYGIEIVVRHFEGTPQEWAFKEFRMPQYKDIRLKVDDFPLHGTVEVEHPCPKDFAVFSTIEGIITQYGLYYEEDRIMSKLGMTGPVIIHPLESFAYGSTPTYYRKLKDPI